MTLLLFLKPSHDASEDTHDGFPKTREIEVEVIKKPKVKAKRKREKQIQAIEFKKEREIIPLKSSPLFILPQSAILPTLEDVNIKLLALRAAKELENEKQKLELIAKLEAQQRELLEEIDDEILILLFGET